ncbi:MAG: hypothetical protein ABIT96_09385 [Ferruginibacter sp.]
MKRLCDSPKLPYQVLTDSVKTWLPYSADKDIIFEDINLQTDTLRLQNYFAGDDDIYRGDECPSGSGQFIRCNFYDSKTNDTIMAEIGYKFIFMTFRKSVLSRYDDNRNLLSFSDSEGSFNSTIYLNGKLFYNSIRVECSRSPVCIPTGITKYYFAKNKGLIAYVRNNVLWTLK